MPAKNIQELVQVYDNAAVADYPSRARGVRNTLALSGLDAPHWTTEERAMLKKAKFDTNGNFSLLSKFIRALAGTYLQSGFMPQFLSRDDTEEGVEFAEVVNKAYVSERNNRRYKKAKLTTIVAALAYRGVEEIFIDRPSLFDPSEWGIGYRNIRSDQIIFDTNVKGDDVATDSDRCWKFGYYSKTQLMTMFYEQTDTIKTLIRYQEFEEQNSPDTPNTLQNSVLEKTQQKRNGMYQIVEYYEVVTEPVKVQVYIGDGNITTIPTFEDLESADERLVEVRKWARDRGFDLTEEENVVKGTEPRKVLYLTIFVPELNLVLAHGKDERSNLNRIPFYTLSYQTMNGISSGMVDFLWTPHHKIHEREATKDKYLKQVPVQKPYIYEEMFEGDNAGMKQFISKWSDSTEPLILKGNISPGMAERYMGVTPKVDIPSIVTGDESFQISMLHDISGQNQASFGNTERSGESGKQLRQKMLNANIAQIVPMEWDSEYELLKAKGFQILGTDLYSGLRNTSRTFGGRLEGGAVVVNEIQGFTEFGLPVFKNDMSDMGNLELDIIKSYDSDDFRTLKREELQEFLRHIQPSESNAEAISLHHQELLLNKDFKSAQERRYVHQAVDRMRLMDRLIAEAKIKEAEARIAEAESRITQAGSTQTLIPSREEAELKNNAAAGVQAEMSIQQSQQPPMPEGQQPAPPQQQQQQ